MVVTQNARPHGGESPPAKIFSREDTPTEKRVLGAFLYHAGLSFRKIERFVDCCYEAIRDWFHRCEHLFEPDCRDRQEVAADETEINIHGEEHYVWAAVDCATLEVLHVEVSPGRSSLDALLFLKEVLKRFLWYDWLCELLDCNVGRETWGNRPLIEAWFGVFKYRTRRFWHRFPAGSTADSTRS
jgi:putative transposase